MSTVAITGVSGYLGQTLLGLIEKDDSIEKVIGIDLGEPRTKSSKLEFHRLDIRDTALGELLKGADTVVHLAFVLNPIRDEMLMHDINIGGTRNVLDAVAAAGVRKVVYPSSVSAYGARADNDYPLTEESRLRPNPDFNYGEHKAENERQIEEWRREHPDVIFTMFRPQMVFGPHVQNFMSRTLEMPMFLCVSGYEPPLQMVHEDDVAKAFHFAINNDLDGVYNLCCDDDLSRSEVLEISEAKPLALPEALVFAAAKWGWRLGLTEAPAGEINYLMYPWTMSNEKLKEAGFSPTYSNREALAQTHEANKNFVTLGRWRMTRDEYNAGLRKGAIVLGVIVVLGMLRSARKRSKKKAG